MFDFEIFRATLRAQTVYTEKKIAWFLLIKTTMVEMVSISQPYS
jgi:hypothetical protein